MNREIPSGSAPRSCGFPWCTTDHGATVHPADEDHRSAGTAIAVRAREAGNHGRGETTDWEVGVLRRSSDDETWVVVETGRGLSLALSVEGARALATVLREDPDLSTVLRADESAR